MVWHNVHAAGHMADIGDIKAMSNYALEILKDEAVLKLFKANAAAHAKKYDISNIIPLYEKLYERFLDTEETYHLSETITTNKL